MRTRRILVVWMAVALLALPHVASAQAGQAGQPAPIEAYVIPGEEVFPEGIAYQGTTRSFFVSSTTDGTIYRGTLGDEEMTEFLPGDVVRTTAVGLAVDQYRRLFVAGGGTGKMLVYDTLEGDLLAAFDNQQEATFVNDVAVTRMGEAFFADSMHPVIYRVSGTPGEGVFFEPWLNLEGTAIEYQEGFNLNGIVATGDGAHLIVVQSNTGMLFRITIATQEITPIDVGDAVLTAGDGLVLDRATLYVVRNQFGEIVVLRMTNAFTRGEVTETITDESFAFPTTAAVAGGRLLVVNAQFDQRGGQPSLPFTVSSIDLP